MAGCTPASTSAPLCTDHQTGLAAQPCARTVQTPWSVFHCRMPPPLQSHPGTAGTQAPGRS
eukprot:211573-Lingulodinium_polyedra.AAC.1